MTQNFDGILVQWIQGICLKMLKLSMLVPFTSISLNYSTIKIFIFHPRFPTVAEICTFSVLEMNLLCWCWKLVHWLACWICNAVKLILCLCEKTIGCCGNFFHLNINILRFCCIFSISKFLTSVLILLMTHSRPCRPRFALLWIFFVSTSSM